MYNLRDLETRIAKRIKNFKTPVQNKIKKINHTPKTEAKAERKKIQMLKILDNKSLKAGVRLKKVMDLLNGK